MAWLKTISGVEIDETDGMLDTKYKYGAAVFVRWLPGHKWVNLDGEFTVEQLLELVEHLKKYSGDSEEFMPGDGPFYRKDE